MAPSFTDTHNSHTTYKELASHFGRPVNTNEIDIFSHWIYTAILAISELPNVDFSITNIRRKLKEEFPEEKIEKAICDLFCAGLLTTDKN